MRKILIWDWPVRIGHGVMIGSFVLAWLTAESDRFTAVHLGSGAAFLACVAFRLVWGVLGSRPARFRDFVRGPAVVRAYLLSILRGRPAHFAGHNPAGGWAILGLLGLGLLTGLSGWALAGDAGGHWLEEWHEGLASALLALAVVHVVGVVLGSLVHRENLIRAMLTGRKAGMPGEGIASARPGAAAILLVWVGIAVLWMIR